jgi:hypothetical protein
MRFLGRGRFARRAVLGCAAALVAAGVLAPMTSAHAAVGSVFVSEVSPWASGNSPVAADWFELTNTTASPVDISGWKMDDNSNSFAVSVALNGVTTIAPGESVIFLESSSASIATLFRTTWWGSVGASPASLQIGTYSGSGVGLSSSGDAVNVYDASGTLISNVSFGASTAVPTLRSFDNAAAATGAISTLSTVGVNGAFLASTETGSPGAIAGTPPPTTTTAPGATTTTVPTTTTTAAPGPVYQTWPGSPNVSTVDQAATFTSNLSGLDYEGTGSAVPGVIWGVVNGPGTLYRLVFDGTNWVPDTANGWSAGKPLRYPSGLGDPDSEGVTFVGDSSSVDGIYVSTERDNSASSTSKLSVLRFDPTAAGATLTATNEWNLTADIPPTGANLGLEAITWIQDSFLTANGFFDDTKGHLYNPTDYPTHGTGLFFVGVEGSGMVYAYALNPDNSFARVTSFTGGFTPTTIMDLQFDRDLNDLWAVCDNSCAGRMNVLRINPSGHFEVALRFERPATLPDTNDEGFAIAPATYCVGGVKPVFWADDNDINTFSLRTGTLPCTAIAVPPPVQVPEFPLQSVAVGSGLALIGVWFLMRRRNPSAVTSAS